MQISNPKTLSLAQQFFTQIAPSSPRLFILGDFVEYWIGDDADDGSLDSVFDAVALLKAQKTDVYLMHGNRDFLIGEHFANRLNAQLIRQDHHLFQTTESTVLLLHGDTLCIDDKAYQTMRDTFHSPTWQRGFLSKTIAERKRYALTLREESHKQSIKKEHAIMDVAERAVHATMIEHDVTTLIHGHTHKPEKHNLMVANKPSTRWVLGDWHANHAVYAIMKNGAITLERFTG